MMCRQVLPLSARRFSASATYPIFILREGRVSEVVDVALLAHDGVLQHTQARGSWETAARHGRQARPSCLSFLKKIA